MNANPVEAIAVDAPALAEFFVFDASLGQYVAAFAGGAPAMVWLAASAGLLVGAFVEWAITRRRRPRSMRTSTAIGVLVWLAAVALSLALAGRLSLGGSTVYLAYRLAWLAAPLAVLALRLRVFPERRLVLAASAPAVLSLGMLASEHVFWAVLACDVAVALAAIVDLTSLPEANAFAAERQTGRIASLKKKHAVTLSVMNLARKAYALTVRDGVPHELHPEPDEFVVQLGPRRRATLRYGLRATRRGAFELGPVYVQAQSRLGLWRRLVECACESRVHVYPDLKQIEEYALLARTNRLNLVGVRRTRRVGQDNEFERLRDYTLDDNFRHIDWRSTARRGKLTVKDFQANQSQRLVFLIDCGRMMTAQSAGLSLLDHALNAMLMLSYVALSKGDSVGLVAFSDEIHSLVPPRAGLKHMNQLLHASFDRFPRMVESRYDEAFLSLATRCRKRSLVVLITNIVDEVNANQVYRHLSTISGRHLPLGVLLRDHRLFDAVEGDQPQDYELFRAAAAAEILSWRDQVLVDLESKGVLSLDVFPEELTAPLVNRYLDIKARHLL